MVFDAGQLIASEHSMEVAVCRLQAWFVGTAGMHIPMSPQGLRRKNSRLVKACRVSVLLPRDAPRVPM